MEAFITVRKSGLPERVGQNVHYYSQDLTDPQLTTGSVGILTPMRSGVPFVSHALSSPQTTRPIYPARMLLIGYYTWYVGNLFFR